MTHRAGSDTLYLNQYSVFLPVYEEVISDERLIDRPRLITAKEFEKFNPEWRYDLIDGELRPMPCMPGAEHGAIVSDFAVAAGSFVRQNRLGKCFAAGTRFTIQQNPDTSIGPDWVFIRKERLPQKLSRGFAPIVPDAVLEVRSPADTKNEV